MAWRPQQLWKQQHGGRPWGSNAAWSLQARWLSQCPSQLRIFPRGSLDFWLLSLKPPFPLQSRGRAHMGLSPAPPASFRQHRMGGVTQALTLPFEGPHPALPGSQVQTSLKARTQLVRDQRMWAGGRICCLPSDWVLRPGRDTAEHPAPRMP